MPFPYTRIPLDQGTDEWHAWRMQGIGASEAPCILGENPWKTRRELFAGKCGRVGLVAESEAMAFGTQTEPEARAAYIATVGVHVEPACVQSTEHAWLRASLDGLALDGSRVVEIKCGTRVHEHAAKTHRPPIYYKGQLQHILAVTGLAVIDFWCYLPGKPNVHLVVERNDAYIGRLLEAEAAFWAQVTSFRAGRGG